MKKYAVMVLAVILAGISSCAWGAGELTVEIQQRDAYYVGEELLAIIRWDELEGEVNYKFTHEGTIPQGCEFTHNAKEPYTLLVGTPEAEGTYLFTVNVDALIAQYDSRGQISFAKYSGTAEFTMKVLHARNGNQGDNTGNNTGDNTGGNTGNNTNGNTGGDTGGNTNNNNGNISFEDWLKRNGNTYNNNTGGNTDNNNGVSSSGGGGGGCNSGLAVLALALTALITLRKSRS